MTAVERKWQWLKWRLFGFISSFSHGGCMAIKSLVFIYGSFLHFTSFGFASQGPATEDTVQGSIFHLRRIGYLAQLAYHKIWKDTHPFTPNKSSVWNTHDCISQCEVTATLTWLSFTVTPMHIARKWSTNTHHLSRFRSSVLVACRLLQVHTISLPHLIRFGKTSTLLAN